VIFVVCPGGFETQIGWFYAFLPGAFVAELVFRLAPNGGQIVQLSSVFIFSLLWYFLICFGVIKVCRIAVRLARA
jgi:hypothetical protein